MTFSTKPNTIQLTPEELEALPRATAYPTEGCFVGRSVAIGHAPMVGQWVNDPLDGWKRVWYHVEIVSPRAFHSCRCGLEFSSGYEFVNHNCQVAA